MIAERMKAYNLIDSISDDKMLLVVDILEAFKKSEEFSHAKKSKTPLFPYKEESAREDYRTALLNDTFVIPTDIDADEYVRELRKDERIF
ncbi:MAG: hypothetical protein IKN43_12725 [Selenomonadaceae bacterium]|nr:hypothetical protein [Selenomonadaceae bacterium]